MFELIAHNYERWSTLIIFGKWGSIFGDNTMTVAAIDRLVHHGEIYQIQGRYIARSK
ncbi:ATP-binding protein [Shewanella sp. SP1S1-7]|uniref:ATP-binding protein n=1 Tax=Shewanella sp. SP1S1-7 TaxID=3063536 RepID=UPI003908AEC3